VPVAPRTTTRGASGGFLAILNILKDLRNIWRGLRIIRVLKATHRIVVLYLLQVCTVVVPDAILGRQNCSSSRNKSTLIPWHPEMWSWADGIIFLYGPQRRFSRTFQLVYFRATLLQNSPVTYGIAGGPWDLGIASIMTEAT
jgi:hypothetical protein